MSDFAAPSPRPKRSEMRKANRRLQRKRPRNQQPGAPRSGAPRSDDATGAVTTKVRPPWKKRVIIGSISLVIILVALVGTGFWYVHWRFSQLHREHVVGLSPPQAGKPFDILLVGSDSRNFVDGTGEAGAFGSATAVTGQRSDVIIIARIVPATHQIKLLSIPRDTYVDIAGNDPGISGPNRINAAYDSGPSLLVQTITSAFHIPISYYTEVNFLGFAGMVNALGGIDLNFPDMVRDSESGLSIDHTGCQVIRGGEALALVRSRHLSYYKDGEWLYDGLSDFSRIQRQDAFFRAVVAKVHNAITDPFALNSFLGATTKNITVDQTLSEGQIISLARIFRSFSSSELVTETLPTAPFTDSVGADLLEPAVSADETMISQFLDFGTTSASTTAQVRRSSHTVGTLATLTASESASTSVPPVTSIINNTPSSSDIVYNTQPEPWNPTPCSL